MLNQITLRWNRRSDTPILSVDTDDLPRSTLRHYARRAGFIEHAADNGAPVFLATAEQREALLCLLESAGYDIDEVTL